MQRWLEEFIDSARAQNALLRKNGAEHLARAREALLEDLVSAAVRAEEETLTVEEAAAYAGVHEETVRRAVRRGEILDLRDSRQKGSPIRVRKSDVEQLKGKRRRKNVDKHSVIRYDAAAHLREILAAG